MDDVDDEDDNNNDDDSNNNQVKSNTKCHFVDSQQ
jgi:hypothetical protein